MLRGAFIGAEDNPIAQTMAENVYGASDITFCVATTMMQNGIRRASDDLGDLGRDAFQCKIQFRDFCSQFVHKKNCANAIVALTMALSLFSAWKPKLKTMGKNESLRSLDRFIAFSQFKSQFCVIKLLHCY